MKHKHTKKQNTKGKKTKVNDKIAKKKGRSKT